MSSSFGLVTECYSH